MITNKIEDTNWRSNEEVKCLIAVIVFIYTIYNIDNIDN